MSVFVYLDLHHRGAGNFRDILIRYFVWCSSGVATPCLNLNGTQHSIITIMDISYFQPIIVCKNGLINMDQ